MAMAKEDFRESARRTTIVICTVDRLADLDACLKSLAPFKADGAEVMVVDNGHLGAEVAAVANRHGATLIHEPRRGVSRARNAGIRATTGDILAFLDDDSAADPSWLPALLEPLRDPEIFAVVGGIDSQSVSDPVSRTFDALHRAQFPQSSSVYSGNDQSGEFPMRMALVGNANMAIRREAFERFGYFDPRFGRGTRVGSGEEPDLLLRILLGSGKIAVVPTARIIHRHSTEASAVKRWAFASGCAHTAMLTKYFFREPTRRGEILRYTASRLRRTPTSSPEPAASRPPKSSFLLGSLYGPFAYFLSR